MASANALKARLAARKMGGANTVGKKAKSAAQLEEEEAHRKALDMEIEEMERREKERWDRLYRFITPPDVIGGLRRYFADKLKIALHRIEDREGRIYVILKRMMIRSKPEKWQYVRLWMDLDDKRRNRVSYDRFCKYFRFAADPWTRRLFDLVNVSLTGTLSFYDFLVFSEKYLTIDKGRTEEFGFRMFSRRGQQFKKKFSVLDLEDMRLFLKYRFKINEPKELSKIALDVFEYVDSDGDGGLFFDEWQEFNIRNWVFVRFFHCYLTHMRKVIFGVKYWVEKTRAVKSKHAKGLDNLSFSSRININDEKWTVVDLKDPVIDGRNRPISTQLWQDDVGTKDDAKKGLDINEAAEVDDLAQELLDAKDQDDPMWKKGDDELTEEEKKRKAEEEARIKKEQEETEKSKNSRRGKNKDAEMRQKQRKEEKEAAAKKETEIKNPHEVAAASKKKGAQGGAGDGKNDKGDKSKKTEDEESSLRQRNFILVNGKLQEFRGNQLVSGEYEDTRKEVTWRGPFIYTPAAKRKFQEDFTEVHVARLQRQYLKDLKKKEEKDLSKKMAGRTYKKLVRVCEDLIYARRWLRMGFNRWADAVGMESTVDMDKKSEADLIAGKREVGKKQMAKLMSKTVQRKGMFQKTMTAEERAQVEALEMELKLLAESEARARAAEEKSKAEEEGEYALHATILKNCKKQELEIHDEDNVFSDYTLAEKARLALPLIKGDAHRQTHVATAYESFLDGDPDIAGLTCLADMAAREELKSRAGTSFSNPNSRGTTRQSRQRSRTAGGSPSNSPERGRSGSPSRGRGLGTAASRVDTSHARRKAAELPPPGTKLPGLTGGLKALFPKSTILHDDELRFGLTSRGKMERDRLEDEGFPAVQRSNSPLGESKWSVEPPAGFEDVDPDSYHIDNEFEPVWYPTYNNPDAPISNRKSNPERSYIFDVAKEFDHDSDSSADL